MSRTTNRPTLQHLGPKCTTHFNQRRSSKAYIFHKFVNALEVDQSVPSFRRGCQYTKQSPRPPIIIPRAHKYRAPNNHRSSGVWSSKSPEAYLKHMASSCLRYMSSSVCAISANRGRIPTSRTENLQYTIMSITYMAHHSKDKETEHNVLTIGNAPAARQRTRESGVQSSSTHHCTAFCRITMSFVAVVFSIRTYHNVQQGDPKED